MATRIDRMEVCKEYNKACERWGIGTILERRFEDDDTIDAFGKFTRAGITQKQLLDVLELSEDGIYWQDFLKSSVIKTKIKELGLDDGVEFKPDKRKKVKKEVDVDMSSVKIDGDAVFTALGTTIAKSITGEFAPLVAESAVPLVEKLMSERYEIKKKVVTVSVPDMGEATAVFHEMFKPILKTVLRGFNVFLVGDAGTGKNVIAEQIAEVMKLPFYFANKFTDEFQVKGFVDANGKYQSTAFYEAFKNGGVFMLDEMDACDSSSLIVLNAALANRYFTFPNGEFVRANENFRCVAGGNTTGNGATYQYVGRNQLDASSLNRFVEFKIDYSPAIEESLTDDESLLKFIREFRKCCREDGINHVVSYRNIQYLDGLVEDLGVDMALRCGLLKNLEKDDLTMLKHKFDTGWSDNKWAKALLKCME